MASYEASSSRAAIRYCSESTDVTGVADRFSLTGACNSDHSAGKGAGALVQGHNGYPVECSYSAVQRSAAEFPRAPLALHRLI